MHLLGIDVGTSATKASLIDSTGSVSAVAEAPHQISRPRSGWSEQDPQWWWDAACRAIREAIHKSNIRAAEIGAVGLSGQMHGSVFLAKEATPENPAVVRPAILWNDQRTAEECDLIEEAVGGRQVLIERTGNRALTGFTAPKILWLKRHEPDHYERTACVLLPKDYVQFRLTGSRVTDVGDASGTLLLDLRSRNWRRDVIDAIGIDQRVLPDVVESITQTGIVSAWAGSETGLLAGTPVIAGSGDQMTGAVGAGIIEPGLVSATLGTSGVMFAHAGAKIPTDPTGRLQIMCAAAPGEYCLYGCMLSAAGALQWFREAFAPERSFDALDTEAAGIGIGAGGLIFLPYLTGERCPHADADARGAFIGLTAAHQRGHLARAVLEGVACAMGEILDLIRASGTNPKEVRALGGGAKSPLWRAIQAAAYATPLTTLTSSEGSAYGAAILAGVGVGCWESLRTACRLCLQSQERIEPAPEHVHAYQRVREIYSSFYPILRDGFPRLGELEQEV